MADGRQASPKPTRHRKRDDQAKGTHRDPLDGHTVTWLTPSVIPKPKLFLDMMTDDLSSLVNT
jgi:hypothetical protein